MLYFYPLEVNTPGFEETIPVIINASRGDVAEQGTLNMLKNPNMIEAFKGSDEEISVAWFNDMEVPLIVCDASTVNGDKVVNVADVWGLMKQAWERCNGDISKEMMAKVLQIVSARYSKEEAAVKIAMCKRQMEYEALKESDLDFALNVNSVLYDDLAIMTGKRVTSHNSAFTVANQIINPEDNVTLPQNDCEDELYIEIPDFSFLEPDEVIQFNKIIPNRTQVCTPYSDVNAESPKYKEKVAKYLIPMIEGDPANNNLGIQPNEQRYYDTLCRWVENNIKEDLGEDADGSVIDRLSQNYLNELSQRVYSWHWRHNRNMPLAFFDEENDDLNEDLDKESSSTESKYGYRLDPEDLGGNLTRSNALVALERFLEEASAKLGYKVYVEAVIKLARWGKRKPTALAFDGIDVVFDLGTNLIKRNLGNISDYTVELVSGKQHTLKGVIILNSDVADKRLGVEGDKIRVPVGIIVTTKMTKGDSELIIPQYVSIVDALQMIKNGELSIVDVDVEDGVIKTEMGVPMSFGIRDLIEDYNNDADSFLQNPFYRSKELMDICIIFGPNKNVQSQNLMAIMNEAICDSNLTEEFRTFAIADMDELRDKMMNGEIFSIPSALNVNVTKVLMPYFLKADKAWRDSTKTMQDFFNIWQDVLKDNINLNSFWKDKTGTAQESVAQESVEGNRPDKGEVKEMSAFSAEPSHKSNINEKTTNTNALIRSIKPDATFIKLVDFEGERIGAYTKEVYKNGDKTVKKFIFVDNEYLNTVPEERIVNRDVSILKVFYILMKDLYAMNSNQLNGIHAFFCSNNAIINYCNAIRKTTEQVIAFKASTGQNGPVG